MSRLLSEKKEDSLGVAFAYNPTGFVEGGRSPYDPDLKQGVYSSELSYFFIMLIPRLCASLLGQPENFGHGLKLSLYSLFPQTDLSLMGLLCERGRIEYGDVSRSPPFHHTVLAGSGALW